MKLAIALLLALVPLAADAGVFATATGPNGRQVILYDDECEKASPQTFKVDLLATDGTKLFAGYWYSTGLFVEIKWEDNGSNTVPIHIFTLAQRKPTI